MRIIIRKKYFSDKSDDKKELAKDLIVPAGIVGTGVGVGKASISLMKSGAKEALKDHDSVIRELAKEAKKKGLKFVDEKNNFSREFVDLKKKELHLSKFGQSSPSTVAHELGHFDSFNGDNGKLQKLVHKHYHNISKPMSRIMPIGSFGAGYANGSREKEGKDEIKALKWGSRLAPALVAAPVLIAEKGASVSGYKKLKNLGLDKESLKDSKKYLTGAWLSYAKAPVVTTGLNEAGYQVGKYLGKKKKKKEE